MERTARIYGKVVNAWSAWDETKGREVYTQYEVSFTEYSTEDGSEIRRGTEDFSPARFHRDVKTAWVYVWDGIARNRGGKRSFIDEGRVLYNPKQSKEARAVLKSRYPWAKLIELR